MNAACRIDRPNLCALRALYGRAPEELASQLHEVGEAIAAQCAELARDPAPDRCEVLAANLNGAARYCMRLRSALLAHSKAGG